MHGSVDANDLCVVVSSKGNGSVRFGSCIQRIQRRASTCYGSDYSRNGYGDAFMTAFKAASAIREESTRELILVVGHPGCGKSRFILSLARYWELLHEDATVWIVDTEHGLGKLLKEQFKDVENVVVADVADADEAITAIAEVSSRVKPDDWVCFESLGRNWEDAQDLASMTTVGMPKSEYLSQWLAKTKGKGSPIPQADMYWQIAKDAHVRNVVNKLTKLSTKCHVLVTTTLPPEKPKFKGGRNARDDVAGFLGITVSPDGAPRNPYYFDTVLLMQQDSEGYWGSVLKDRGYTIAPNRFPVTDAYADLIQIRMESTGGDDDNEEEEE